MGSFPLRRLWENPKIEETMILGDDNQRSHEDHSMIMGERVTFKPQNLPFTAALDSPGDTSTRAASSTQEPGWRTRNYHIINWKITTTEYLYSIQ